MTQRVVIGDDGKPRVVLAAAPTEGQQVVVDYLGLTMDEEKPLLALPGGVACVDVMKGLIHQTINLTGLQPTTISDVHVQGYRLGKHIDDYATLGVAGAGRRVYLAFSGRAFVKCDGGFLHRIYEFLHADSTSRITRIDLAYDDFLGEKFDVWSVEDEWNAGLLDSSTGIRPKLEFKGDYARRDPFKLGVSAYLGSKGNELVIYEKDKQQGNKDGRWVRVEQRFSNANFVILEDVLLNPTAYFIGARPYLATKLAGVAPLRKFERVAREGINDFDRCVRIIKEQYGRYLKTLRREFFENDAELLDAIVSDDDVVPKSLVRALENLKVAAELAEPLETT